MDLLDSIFEIKYAKSTGDSTQQQFATLCEYFYGDKFSSPHSLKNKGDKGADGIVSKEGIYFQVFSPENNQDKKACQKMETDLQTIIDTSPYIQHNPITKYIFFYNQPKKVSLSSAFVTKKLELEHKFKIEVAIWQFSHLKRHLFDVLSHSDRKVTLVFMAINTSLILK